MDDQQLQFMLTLIESVLDQVKSCPRCERCREASINMLNIILDMKKAV